MMMSDALVIAVGTHNKSKLVFELYVGLHGMQYNYNALYAVSLVPFNSPCTNH